jgi:8-oxo-dGTP pyrophosphatase MutT (NUDIX family)
VTAERIDVAQVLIEREGRVLVVHTIGPAGSSIDRWGLPGDGREPGETLVQAARREVREKTGLDVVVEHRWLSPHAADALMPWYPDGVQALLDGRVGYYAHPEEPGGG